MAPIKAMEDEREVKAIVSCVETQSLSKSKEMLGNVVKSTNASKRKSENLPTCEKASQGMVSSLINWWNSGGADSTKVNCFDKNLLCLKAFSKYDSSFDTD